MKSKLPLVAAMAMLAAGSAQAAPRLGPPTPFVTDETMQQAQYNYNNWRNPPGWVGPGYYGPWGYPRRFRSDDPEFRNGP